MMIMTIIRVITLIIHYHLAYVHIIINIMISPDRGGN